MNVPRLIFRYAYPLDDSRRQLSPQIGITDYPSQDVVVAKCEEYRELWELYNKDNIILKKLTELLGIEYTHDIEIFVFGGGLRPMSLPFLLPVLGPGGIRSAEATVAIIIHELIHVFVGQEDHDGLKEYWQTVRHEYQDESITTQNHLIVYAVLDIALTEIFGKEKVSDLIKTNNSEYQRAITIVLEKGAESIIADFQKFIN